GKHFFVGISVSSGRPHCPWHSTSIIGENSTVPWSRSRETGSECFGLTLSEAFLHRWPSMGSRRYKYGHGYVKPPIADVAPVNLVGSSHFRNTVFRTWPAAQRCSTMCSNRSSAYSSMALAKDGVA